MPIKIVDELCKGCGYCIEICPKEIFKNSNEKFNKKGYHVPHIQNAESCIYCRKCELICPEMAISIEKEDDK